MVITAYFVVGCSQDDSSSYEVNDDYLEFLSIDSPVPESDIDILKKAKNRIEPYIVYKDNQYEVNIKNGKQIQISEDLFQMFCSKVERTNHAIKMLSSCPDILIVQDKKRPKLLHISVSTIRLKTGNTETNPGGEEMTWDSIVLNDCVYQCIVAIISILECPSKTVAQVKSQYETFLIGKGWSPEMADFGVFTAHITEFYSLFFNGSGLTADDVADLCGNFDSGNVSLMLNGHNVVVQGCIYTNGILSGYECYDPQMVRDTSVTLNSVMSGYRVNTCKQP
jgi:hypothetical protein